MAYSSITKPEDHFNTKLYTGNGTNPRSITGVGFKPDWLWIKRRDDSGGHNLYDVVRGSTKRLESHNTGAEATTSDISSFDSDGFTVNTTGVNTSSATYVAWNWLAGGSASSNGDGSITSTVSANTTAGFSIVTYTGTGSAATVGHGLGAVPKMFWTKRRDSSESWGVYHHTQGAGKYLRLESTNAVDTSSTLWNNTTPTSSVFSIAVGGIANTSSGTYVAYCFAEIPGYSKFGSFTGNGSTDGTFIYTGFKPSFVIVKESSGTSNWLMFDNKRDISNGVDAYIKANASDSEYSGTDYMDFLSNGFKCRNAQTFFNESGSTYIYMAFAENPFVANDSGTVVPVTAR